MKIKTQILDHKIIFSLILLVCMLFLTYVQFFLNKAGNINRPFDSASVTEFNDFELYEGDLLHPIESTDNFKIDDCLILKSTIPDELELYSTLGFYTLHQNINIYIGDELVYEFIRNPSEMKFGNTPGHGFHFIENLYKYRGEEITIYLNSPYPITNIHVPKFTIGDTANLIIKETKNSAYTIISGLTIMLLGCFSILMWLLFRKHISQDDLTLLYAGIFCICLSIWIINEQPILSYYLNNSIITSYMSFISLMFITVSLILFFRELCKTKTNPLWNIMLGINYLIIIVTIVLQFLNIMDFKECLVYNQSIFFISMIIISIYSAYITFKHHADIEGKITFVSIVLLYIGYFIYLYKFFTNELYELSYGSIFIIIYIIGIVTLYIRRSILVMIKSDKVEFFENLAYRDSLTELYNRLAYDHAISAVDVNSASYIIVIFDLNNLKHFNDTYGHNIGDTYIKDSSKLIKKAFNSLGSVYRIGGDEFCIIMKDKSIFQYETATRKLDTLVYNYNRVSEVLKINIAYGYALYDKSIDRDIHETRNRADAMMYKKKFFMKQNQTQKI